MIEIPALHEYYDIPLDKMQGPEYMSLTDRQKHLIHYYFDLEMRLEKLILKCKDKDDTVMKKLHLDLYCYVCSKITKKHMERFMSFKPFRDEVAQRLVDKALRGEVEIRIC